MDRISFLQHRRPEWDRLAALLSRVEKAGLAELTAAESESLFTLYRRASNDLNLVASRGGNPALAEFLEALVARAYAQVAAPRTGRSLRRTLASWWETVRFDFPAIIRRERGLLLLAAIAMVAGIAFGFVACWHDSTLAEAFLGGAFPEHLRQSPAERVAAAEALERGVGSMTVGKHTAFSTMLFTHNITVSFLSFALGLTAGVFTVVFLFYNGAILGSLAALYVKDGVGVFFVAWVGPHGVLELPAFALAGLAGLMLGRAMLRRDEGPLADQLRRMGPDLVKILTGSASLLVVAGLIEGGFSQVNEPTLAYWFKISVAAALLAALVVYLFVMPVRKKARAAVDEGGGLAVKIA